jgi:hypothetical protein
MRINESIWKSGALAAAATVAFTVFVYVAAATIAPLQRTVSTATCADETTKIIPQIAVGSFDKGSTSYTTLIEIMNTSGGTATVFGSFYRDRPDGRLVPNNLGLTAETELDNGTLPPTFLPKDAVFVISGNGTAAAGSTGWGKITSCGSVRIMASFELREPLSATLYSRVAVTASPANMSKFVIPRVHNLAAGLDVGISIVNVGDADAILTAELIDASGQTLANQDIQMPAGSHRSRFPKDLFPKLTERAAGREFQYVRFTSSSASFAAAGIASEGYTLTGVPVEQLQ